MIIYDMRKPKNFDGTNCIGITGENLAMTQEFLIHGMTDITTDYFIHLRFADGSVNSVIPDSVTVDKSGTKIVWKVRKNDIFMHGYFELQIEGRGDDGLVFQTQIVTLYADESIPVEDREYLNPNSETLKLREETKKALDECRQIIEKSDLNKKEDLSNKVDDTSKVLDESRNYPSIKYLNDNYWSVEDSYSSDEIDVLANEKADKKIVDERLSRMENNVNSKFDLSNIEYGKGNLSPASATYEGSEGNFNYSKIGKTVTVALNVTALTAGKSYVQLIGLPYRAITASRLSSVAVYTTTNKLVNLRVDGTWLYISTLSTAFAEGEKVNAIITYIIG